MSAPNHPNAAQLVISAVAVNGAYGDHPAALLGGISTRLSCRSKVCKLQTSTEDQTVETPYWAACEEWTEEIQAELRLQLLCLGALETLPAPADPAATLIVNLLPGDASLQDERLFTDNLTSALPACAAATVQQYVVDQAATAILARVLEDFRQGPWQQLIFGGCDCLTTRSSLQEAMQQRDCCSDLNPDRRLLGEGAAYLVIDKVAKASAGHIVITGLAQRDEPNHGNAASKATTALASCIQTCLATSGLESHHIHSIVSGYVPDLPGTLEWHQTERKLWPDRHHRSPIQEELNPHLGIGDCGTANLPTALALAWARYDFTFAPVTTIIVCDISTQPQRGAICLQQVTAT